MNFAKAAVHYWLLAQEKENNASRGMDELTARQGVVTPHRTIDTLIGQQQHLLRKAHAAAAIAAVVGHRMTPQECELYVIGHPTQRRDQ